MMQIVLNSSVDGLYRGNAHTQRQILDFGHEYINTKPVPRILTKKRKTLLKLSEAQVGYLLLCPIV